MSMASRVSLFAEAVRDKFNLVTPRLIPAGGTTGQVLKKTGAPNYAMAWQDEASGGGGGGVVGVHCPVSPKPGDIVDASVNGTTAVTVASAVRRCDWVPFIPCYNMNVGSMSVEVTTSVAGSKISLGIYNDASMFPGSPVVESDRLDTDATGVKTWALPTPYTLLKGNVYWLANITTHGVTFRALPVGALLPLALSGTVGARSVCWRVTSGGTLLPGSASGAALTSASTIQVRLHIVS